MNKLSLRRKAAAVLLSAVLSISAVMTAGCGISQAKDEAMLQDLSARFIEAVKSGDEDEIEELTGKEYSYTFKDESKGGIVMQMASKTEIEEYKSIQVDREHNKAKVRLKLSYFSLNDFVRDEGYMMTEEEYTEKIDAYETRVTDYFSISFKLSEDGSWIIDDSAVTRLMSKIDRPYYIQIATISAADAEAAVEGLFAGLAEGDFDQEYYTLDLAEMRAFDDGMYNSDLLDEAVGEFTKAYIGYIVDNGMTCEPEGSFEYAYTYNITGKAPSSDDILAYLSSDERVTEAYMAAIRIESGCSDMTEDEIWSSMYAEIYFDLAKKIPDMDGEDYYQTIYFDTTAYDPEIVLGWSLLPFTSYDMVGAGAVSDAQAQECYIQAVTNLYLAGELTEEQYNEYLDTSEDNDEGAGDFQNEVGFIDWPGTEDHPNQAVLVYEYIPDWSDGTLIYGASDTDENGIYMHYSKEPGWLNTAGYCIDDDGITIMVTFDKSFTMGTVLEYDWELGDEDYGETEQFTVQENGQNTFEFTLPVDSVPTPGGVEFRLWEQGHSHVIAYVYLIQT
jgi:hypothetical protein